MTKTNRRPEITDNGSARIISTSGGRWQVQRWIGQQPNTREACNLWRSAGRPLSYEEARAAVGLRLTQVSTGPRQKRRATWHTRFLARRAKR